MNDVAVIPAELPPAPNWLEKLIEKNIDPAALEKVLEIQERWLAVRAKEAYSAAMARVQKKCNLILTDAVNQHTKKRYASLPTVNNALKPIYSAEGFSLSFGTEDSPLPEHVRIVCDVRHEAGHCERYRGDIPLDGKGAKGGASSMNSCQATGSTYSYGRRYLICLIFNLTVADEDDDGQGSGGKIGAEEIKVINDLLAECREAGHEVNHEKFLAYLDVRGLEEVTRIQFAKALQFLNAKRRGQTKVKTEGGGK